MSKKSRLYYAFDQELKKETKFGQSKHKAKQEARQQAKENNEKYQQVKGIYSKSTYRDYSDSMRTFTNYVLKNHTEVKNISDCRKYVKEYLDDCRDRDLSEWTIHKYAYAIRSAYHCNIENLNITLGERKRANVIRCRDAEFSEHRNNDRYENAINMTIATGCRHAELLRLRKEDFREELDKNKEPTGNMEVYKRGKNGIERWCLVNPAYTEWVRNYLDTATTHKISGTNEERLFLRKEAPQKLALHDLRADYACSLYQYFEEIGKGNGNIYHCRKDLKGYEYDKGVLDLVSYNLQHSRDNVVIDYLWKMR